MSERRERRGLQAKADELAAQLEAAHQRQAEAQRAVAAEAAAQRAALVRDVTVRCVCGRTFGGEACFLTRLTPPSTPCQPQDAELAKLVAESEEQAATLEQQYQAALAVQATQAGHQQWQLEAARAALQHRCSELDRHLAASRRRLAEAEEGWSALRDEHAAALAAAQQAAAAAEQRCAAAEHRLAAATAEAEAQLQALRQRREAEAEELQQRLLGVVAAKDATIAALQHQLADTAEALQHAEAEAALG